MRTQARHLAVPLVVAVMVIAACNPPPAQADPSVPAPANVQGNSLGHTTVGLAWEGPAVDPGDGHRIEYHEAGDPGNVQTVDPGVHYSNGVHTGGIFFLTSDTTYVFRVIRIEDGVESAPSDPLTVTTLAPAPTDLQVKQVRNGASTSTAHLAYVGQSGELYRVYWHEAGSPEDRDSEDVPYTQSYPNPRPPGVNAIIGGLAPSTTYVFEVIHVDDSGDESEPSNQVTIQTGPYDPPEVDVDVDGREVTLTWDRPPHQLGAFTYDVYDNGAIETLIRTESDRPSVTISRPASGVTHSYAIDGPWAGELTDPVTVTVPPSDDATPPTEPGVIIHVDCNDPQDVMRIEVQSTDDTTPQSEIKYEALKWTYIDPSLTREYYVADYDFPLEMPGADSSIRIRAVDEAGNRSALVTPQEVIDC